MKEEEATEKWCPMARCIYPGSPNDGKGGYGPYNRWETGDDLPDGAYCIASNCSMWRWDKVEETSPTGSPMGYHNSDEGYCGLAGKE